MNLAIHWIKNQRSRMTYKRSCRSVGYRGYPPMGTNRQQKLEGGRNQFDACSPQMGPRRYAASREQSSGVSACSGATPFGDCVLTLKTRVWLGVILP